MALRGKRCHSQPGRFLRGEKTGWKLGEEKKLFIVLEAELLFLRLPGGQHTH
jgi:hypothetical protein